MLNLYQNMRIDSRRVGRAGVLSDRAKGMPLCRNHSGMPFLLLKMTDRCVPRDNMKIIRDLLANEKYHYVELHHKSLILDKIWKLGENTRIIEPVRILFSEYYFYLNAYIDTVDQGKYVHQYDYPAIFRMDRISSVRKTGIKFQIPYASRFEEGEFRKRVQFMYAGKLTTIRFRYYGNNPEPVLDRLPTAKIIQQDNTGMVLEAEVYGKGIIMWLLGQGDWVEVLGPEWVRTEMKEKILAMLARYQKNSHA